MVWIVEGTRQGDIDTGKIKASNGCSNQCLLEVLARCDSAGTVNRFVYWEQFSCSESGPTTQFTVPAEGISFSWHDLDRRRYQTMGL